MIDQNWDSILRNINSVLKTRVQGVSWFQFFFRATGEAHPHLGMVPRWFDLESITPLAGEILDLARQLAQAIPSLAPSVEELVLVGQKRRLFIIPLGELVLLIDAQEKIGDVCFHSTWAEEDSPVGIRHYLSISPFECTNPAIPVTVPSWDPSPDYTSICEQLNAGLEQPPYVLGCYNGDLEHYTQHTGTMDGAWWALCAKLRQRVNSLEEVLSTQKRPLGLVNEILIGQEGLRFTRAKQKGSIILAAYTNLKNGDLVVASPASLGSLLLTIRNWNPLGDIPDRPQSNLIPAFDSIKNSCSNCGDSVRLPLLSQLTYDLEKLDLETFCLDFDINPLETPDVAGAIISAAREALRHAPELFGELSVIEMTVYNHDHNEPDLHSAITSINENIAYILISQENSFQFRNQVLECLSVMRQSLAQPDSVYSTDYTDDLSLQEGNRFDDSTKGTFLQVQADVNLRYTPLGINNLKYLLKPSSDSFKSQRQLDGLLAGIVELLDRVRIFIQFILKEHSRPWGLVLAGSQGCISAYVDVQQQKCLIGAACDPNMASVETWILNSYLNPPTESSSVSIPSDPAVVVKKSGGIVYQDIKINQHK